MESAFSVIMGHACFLHCCSAGHRSSSCPAQMTNSGGGETEQRAHAGSVHCIAACGERVWTSGGAGASACLREWSAKGALHNNVELTQDGERFHLAPIDTTDTIALTRML